MAQLLGTSGDDVISADPGHTDRTVPDRIEGLDGNDFLDGWGGDDTLVGGNGDDTLLGGPGSDLLDGGPGFDLVTYEFAPENIVIDLGGGLSTGSTATDTFISIEAARGSAQGDQITGAAGDNAIYGGPGPDVISDPGGANYLRGDLGDDAIFGGTGFDDINGNQGNDTCRGGAGDDWVVGGKENDSLTGDAGGDLVYGNLGADTCDGGDGNDIVRGGQENDICLGGAGDDFVSGDKGDDTMTGGAGADVFHSFGDAGLDRVTDFSRAEGDTVRLDPGTTYAVAQSGADVVISMTGGGQVVLVGVSLASLTGDWIVVG